VKILNRLLLLVLIACISSRVIAIDSNELPTKGVIGAGTGSISQSGRELQVDQSSNPPSFSLVA